MTVGCITVVIHHTDNEIFKICDFHARDLCDNSYPQGTCVLLQVSSVNGIVKYFQSTYKNITMTVYSRFEEFKLMKERPSALNYASIS